MLKIMFAAFLLMVAGCGPARAGTIREADAVKAIIGEAEDQGYRGMLAVAVGIRNRGTLHGVIGFKSKRVRSGAVKRKYYRMALRAWKESKKNRIHTGDHWENVSAFGEPTWAGKMRKVAVVGDHVFYK